MCVDEEPDPGAGPHRWPADPARPRGAHDYVRNGTSSLFAALDVASGRVISQVHRRHRHQEFLKFLRTIDEYRAGRAGRALICDNYATHNTPAIKTWFTAILGWLHFTPTYSSWLGLVKSAGSPS